MGLVGDAAHPMLPTFGQGAAQAFEDAAALGKCFELHGTRHLPRAVALRARALLPRDALPVRVEVPLQAPRAGGLASAPADPRGGQRAGLPRLRSHGACGQRRLVDLRVRRARDRRQAADQEARAVGLPLADRGAQERAQGGRHAASGSRRGHGPATGPSRARSSRSTRRSTTAGSSSAARSTTSPSGRTTTRAGPSSRACTAARTPRRSSASTTAGSPSGTWSTSASGRSSEPPPSAPATPSEVEPSRTRPSDALTRHRIAGEQLMQRCERQGRRILHGVRWVACSRDLEILRGVRPGSVCRGVR